MEGWKEGGMEAVFIFRKEVKYAIWIYVMIARAGRSEHIIGSL